MSWKNFYSVSSLLNIYAEAVTQLWETTLDPESRILAQVSISDTVEADEVTDILMGSNVPPRRQFIMDEAKYANLDI